jgi:alanine racemase
MDCQGIIRSGKPERQGFCIPIRRLVFFVTLIFIGVAGISEQEPDYDTGTTNGSYPKDLISYIREQCKLNNSVERKAETYVEIDQLAYYDNIQLIKKQILKDTCHLMVVLKSDAYGHGIEHLGKIAEYAGADYVGITENQEILRIRSLALKIPVMRIRLASNNELSMVHESPEAYGEVEEMVGNLQMARHLSKLGAHRNRLVLVHISLNSGEMSRDGFDMKLPGTRDSIMALLKLDHIRIKGIMTHFANADTEEPGELRKLLADFRTGADWIIREGALKREEVILHAAATSLTLRVPESHLDMVRLGSITYGEKTDKESPEDLKPIMSVYSSIGQIQFYPAGSKVGYGSTYLLEKDSYLANIPIGKNNGIPRNLEYALIGGQRVCIVGAMSMNATMIDITLLIDQVRSGDQVVFLGSQGNDEITAEEIYASTGVEPWTLHCNVGQLNFGARYPKKPVNE